MVSPAQTVPSICWPSLQNKVLFKTFYYEIHSEIQLSTHISIHTDLFKLLETNDECDKEKEIKYETTKYDDIHLFTI